MATISGIERETRGSWIGRHQSEAGGVDLERRDVLLGELQRPRAPPRRRAR
jgi:hypothetical protein